MFTPPDTYLSQKPVAFEGPEHWVKIEHQGVGVRGVVTGEETHFVLKLNYKYHPSLISNLYNHSSLKFILLLISRKYFDFMNLIFFNQILAQIQPHFSLSLFQILACVK